MKISKSLMVVMIWLLIPMTCVYGQKGELSINLKTEALVLGPKVKLGEIGIISVKDEQLKVKLSDVNLGSAPPPGESKDLTLSYIKMKLRRKGFGSVIRDIKGPRVIRIITAPREIHKVIIKEGVT